jgi:hypothetical protein
MDMQTEGKADMQAAQTAQVAFYLTGQQQADTTETGLNAISGLVPALFGGYRDLTALRYDFPLLLLSSRNDRPRVISLTAAVDAALAGFAGKPEADRVRHHAWLVEQAVRRLLAEGASGTLRSLMIKAAGRLDTMNDRDMADSIRRLGAVLPVDGELLDCDTAMPGRLVDHLWQVAQQRRLAGTGADIVRLLQKISDILDAAQNRSEGARTPDALRAAVGAVHTQVFDFTAFSRVLARAKHGAPLPPARWQRLRWLLSVLQSQRFFQLPGAARASDIAPVYDQVFTSCVAARDAWAERQPKAIELAKAMAMAELEITGEYDDDRHDALFAGFGCHGLDPADAARFPAFLVRINATQLTPTESVLATGMLDAGLPMKLIVQGDDILAPSSLGDGKCGLGLAQRQLVSTALGLQTVFVQQVAAAHLYQGRDKLLDGLCAPGPALVSVFAGSYLASAAATEVRAFPTIVYDPGAGPTQADRFSLDANPQPERDWPLHQLAYQDAACQSVTETVAFSLIDLLACDSRYTSDFARVEPAAWNENMVPATDAMANATGETRVPYILMRDGNDHLHKVVVSERILRDARRCLEMWKGLRECGGIQNSHAERAVARARAEWEQDAEQLHPADQPEAVVTVDAEPAAGEQARSPDEAYIETPRCSTCEECVHINNKMFMYNKDKQAYIADITAGTYRQLVEAAESCQVSIIHPGKPRNPNEPDLVELIARAAPFN